MRYAQDLYGLRRYGGGDADTPQPIEPVDLMAYLPSYWQEYVEMRAIQETMGEEAGTLRAAGAALLEQFFVDTATWGLAYWEYAFGVATDERKSDAFRREQIRAKLRGAGTTTKQMIIQLAAAFSGGEVTVIEYPVESRFVVKFVGIKGIPPNLAGLETAIEQVKPAHLAFAFAYTYNTWKQLSQKRWDSLAEGTWNQVKVV